MTVPATSAEDLSAEYGRRGLDRLSDAQLVAWVADVLRPPRVEPADSFVLHAPLELLARAALLPRVAPGQREAARLRLLALAMGYEAFGPAVAEPAPRDLGSPAAAAARLGAAVAAGDLDDADAAAAWLGRSATADELRRLLAGEVVPRLSAAAHGSIFLFQLPRIAPRGEVTPELLRSLARELARQPEWRLTWFDEPTAARPMPAPGSLLDAIGATPRLGLPGSDFIFPIMSQVESTGVARDLLARPLQGLDAATGGRVVLRSAAWSMLAEPPDHAPYGWSHCLTLPQAVLGIADDCADPNVALAVAATYVVAFRAALAHDPLVRDHVPDDPRADLEATLAADPTRAAAAVWHTPPDAIGTAITELATRAAVHHDAHLVKYTLACLDAAAWDRSHARLYLSAAASLLGYWAARSEPEAAVRTTRP